MWKLCVVDDESNRTVVKLVRSDYSLGRAEDSTIRLTERNISRTHARLYREGDSEWTLEDKNSYTGSFVNGERVSAPRQLKHGDTIQLGDYRLELLDESQQAIESRALDALVSAAQLPDRFVVVQGPGVGTVYPLTEQKLLVGRGEECQIALDDASVSRVHVEVLRTEHGLMILDQGSSNGLRINGADLPSAMLRSGDVVELGDVRLKFVPAGVEDVVTQAAPLSTRAAEIDSSPRSRTGRGTMALYGGGALLVVAVIALAVRPSEDTPTATSVKLEPPETSEPVAEVTPEKALPARADGAAHLLEEASSLATEGAIVAAHRKLSEIPQDSSLRQSEAFKSIERRWADEIFKAAEESPDPVERRSLLDKVAKTPEVDPERRQRAATELAKLEEGVSSVDVADLPSAEKNHGKNAKPQTSVALAANKPKPPAPAPSPTPRRAHAPVAPRTRTGDDGADARTEAPEAPPPATRPPPKQQPPAPEPGLPASELTREPPF
ncbi:MAG TPA: FHA domain-containing protein [Polyangiaceae bacterium]|jgi:pSer/pThr/pTyr-binding forkhead associated (FHA) protein|nr:FHA domain-containing protein [Polyangiaceae bacterium]